MNKLCVALLFALAFLVPPAAAQTPMPTGDACALLTSAEVTQALGAAASGQQLGTSSIICIYSQGGKHGPYDRQVIVTLTPASYFDASNRTFGRTTAKPATVAGASAFYLQNQVGTNIHVRKGDRAFELRFNPGRDGTESKAQVEQIEQALAQKGSARL